MYSKLKNTAFVSTLDKGTPMRVAYEDVRVAHKSELTHDLMPRSLEDELIANDGDEPENHAEPMHRIEE